MSIEYQVVYWRDIPAQVKIRSRLERIGRELPERFQKAIDRAAMLAGLTSTDGYLEEWHTSDWVVVDEAFQTLEPSQVAEKLLQEIESRYLPDRIQSIISNKGFLP